MSYREENGQVVLTMSREDYERVMFRARRRITFRFYCEGRSTKSSTLPQPLKRGEPELDAVPGGGEEAGLTEVSCPTFDPRKSGPCKTECQNNASDAIAAQRELLDVYRLKMMEEQIREQKG